MFTMNGSAVRDFLFWRNCMQNDYAKAQRHCVEGNISELKDVTDTGRQVTERER